MKIIIAPDSFKGCLAAADICLAVEKGIKKVITDAKVTKIPMADGGEGTLSSLIHATNGSIIKVENVRDPLGRPIRANYGVIPDRKTAIIELASASGLFHLQESELDANRASSYGTGQLIRHAIERGYTSFIICLGGSATNDGGAGLLKALGFRFLDRQGKELDDGGLALGELAVIDASNADPRLKACSFKVAGDVNNPLIGPNGASVVFGPQKGASEKDVKQLDQALKHFADVVLQQLGIPVHDLSGGGAAGGTAAGLVAFLNAEITSGVELVKQIVGFDSLLKREQPDFIITGEGKIDAQTGFGKVISGICSSAKKMGIPVIALAGAVSGDLEPLYDSGLTAAFGIADKPMTLQESIKQADRLLEQQAQQLARVIKMIRGE